MASNRAKVDRLIRSITRFSGIQNDYFRLNGRLHPKLARAIESLLKQAAAIDPKEPL